MKRVVLSAQARLELRAAANWYSDREPGLGEDFIVEVGRTLEMLAEGAHRYPSWHAASLTAKLSSTDSHTSSSSFTTTRWSTFSRSLIAVANPDTGSRVAAD